MNFATIQAAVTAANPGDTILADAGTYNEHVTVNKSLILEGARHGVDARTRSGSESIVNGGGFSPFYVTANDVTIDGFTIQGADGSMGNVFPGGFGVELAAGTAGAHVVNNVIQNNIVGMALTNASSTDQAVIQHNLFRNNTDSGPAGGTDIYADQFTAGVGGVRDVLIDGNTFTNTSFVENAWALGISNTDPTPFTNITFSNNTVTNHGRGVYFFSTQGATVSGSSFTGTSHYAIGAFGGVNGLTITSNTIQDGGTGLLVEDDLGAPGTPDPNADIHAHFNNFVNNHAGVIVSTAGSSPQGYAGILDAEQNWWGNSSGPSGAGPGSGDSVSTGVDFSPWLTAPSPSAPAVAPVPPVQFIQDPLNPSQQALVITGTSKDDHIQITPVGTTGAIQVSIDTLGLHQVVDPSSTPFDRIFVYGQDGSDRIEVGSGISTPMLIFAGNGDDQVQAGSGPTLIDGGLGNDTLTAGAGNDVLIGGAGADRLQGGAGKSILIGGTTNYDGNLAALSSILDTWNAHPSPTDFANNTSYPLNAATVHADGAHNQLIGGTGLNWFFAGLATDFVTHKKPGDTLTPVS
jgi:hypothetical protein